MPEPGATDPGATLRLTIEDVAYRGPGVARHEGMVVFINRVAPGERVEAEITRSRKRYAEARLLRVIEASPDRIAPCAEIAPELSLPGCVYDFLDYPAEVDIKQRQLLGLLRHTPDLASLALAPFPAPHPLHYRNKIVLHVQRPGTAPARIGYVGEDNRTVIDLVACPLACDAINFAWEAQREHAGRTLADGQRVTLRWTQADGVRSWVDDAPAEAPLLTEASAAGPIRVPLGGFYQVNPEVADALIRQVRDWSAAAAAEFGRHDLLDLYCGVGVFGLACATNATQRLIGLEQARGAVAAARLNERERKRTATFRGVRVEDAARTGFDGADLPQSLVIADPPRQGLDPVVVRTLGQGQAPHLFYVSCDPATLVRDLQRLQPFGYRLRAVRLFDMFPRTAHFETAVWLSLDPARSASSRPN